MEKDKIEIILKACDSKKAYDFTVLDISKISTISDYFIIVSGNNERQTVAIAEEVMSKAKENGFEIYHVEGMRSGTWVLLDLGDIIVHIFQKDEREVYNLESLWYDENKVDVEQYGIKNWK